MSTTYVVAAAVVILLILLVVMWQLGYLDSLTGAVGLEPQSFEAVGSGEVAGSDLPPTQNSTTIPGNVSVASDDNTVVTQNPDGSKTVTKRTKGYKSIQNRDSAGSVLSDLGSSATVAQLAKACDADSRCVGFSTSGQLKSKIKKSKNRTTAPGVTLYLKKST